MKITLSYISNCLFSGLQSKDIRENKCNEENKESLKKGNESEIVPDYRRLKYSCMLITIKKNMFVKEQLNQ